MNAQTSAVKAKTLNTIQAVNLALDEAMGLDENVIVLGEDVGDEQAGGVAGVTKGLSTKYGKSRVRSTPISEQAIVGAAIGAAIVGLRPVAEVMLMNFTTVCMDMIVNHAAKLRFMSGGQTHVPLTIRMMTGAGFSTGGQHADYLEAWFAHTPGLTVVAPSSPADAYGLMLSSIFDEDPVIFIENMPSYWTPGPAPEAGVRIALRHEARRAQIDIVDAGPGMTPEFVRDDLFRPFRTSKPEGSGIGAYQARELVRGAGGDLLVLSRPGAGTTMRLLLPLVEAGARMPLAASA